MIGLAWRRVQILNYCPFGRGPAVLIIAFCVLVGARGAFIRPNRHTLPGGLQSVSGSDSNGGCAAECVMGGVCECSGNVQTNSALIDGVCPSGGINTQQSNWASDFFTINRNSDSLVRIGFEWSSGFELRGVELKLFNCEPEGTAIHTITVYASVSFPNFHPLVSPPALVGSYLTTVNDINCTGVTTIVIPTTPITAFSVPQYFLEFSFPEGDSNTGIYIAEARFSDTTITTPIEISSTPPSLLTTTTVEQATTTLLPPATTTGLQEPSSSFLLSPSLTDIPSTVQLSRSSSTVYSTESTPRELESTTMMDRITETKLTVAESSVAMTSLLSVSIRGTPDTSSPPNTNTDSPIIFSFAGVTVFLILFIILMFLAFILFHKHHQAKNSPNINTTTQRPVSENSSKENIELNENRAYGEVCAVPQESVDYESIPNALEGHTSQPVTAEGDRIELGVNEAYGELQSSATQPHDYEYVTNVLSGHGDASHAALR